PGGCAAPATSREEDAGENPQHVQMQVPEEGLVRVVDVEHHAVLPRGAVRPVRAEVLEMEVSAEKTFVLGPARQARRVPEHPVEERRRPPEERKGRGGHPRLLPREQDRRHSSHELAVACPLPAGQLERSELPERVGHRRRSPVREPRTASASIDAISSDFPSAYASRSSRKRTARVRLRAAYSAARAGFARRKSRSSRWRRSSVTSEAHT